MRQTTFEETSRRDSGDGRRDDEAERPSSGGTASVPSPSPAARLDVSSTPRTPLQAWLAEKRRRDEREERFEKLLLDPAYLARVEGAAAELRACPECHAPGKASA